MHFIGDVHGHVKTYMKYVNRRIDGPSIQVGDMGMGFVKFPDSWDDQHTFIRGNHDNPEVCQAHPNYLGDYGRYNADIYFVSGAFSIDQEWREPGVSWWAGEEIARKEYGMLLNDYEDAAPEIVVAHDCPDFIWPHIMGGNREDKDKFHSRTSCVLMPQMIRRHIPRLWVFGHYHTFTQTKHNGTEYIGLRELQTWELDA